MAGYMIHLAVGYIYSQNNKIEDLQSFYKGIIAPDMVTDKTKSHYGPNSSNPGLNKYIELNSITNNYNEGYFLHLLTDYLFYNKFLKGWYSEIYSDYDKINKKIKEKYKIVIPKEVKDIVQFKTGELKVLNEEKLYKFIEYVGKINIRELVSKTNINYENEIKQIKLNI